MSSGSASQESCAVSVGLNNSHPVEIELGEIGAPRGGGGGWAWACSGRCERPQSNFSSIGLILCRADGAHVSSSGPAVLKIE
jgi:hypothetical protein